MLILRLNENKTLTLNKTSSNFTGENNFEKIRIIADKTVGGKQLQDLITELYIYNIIDEDWSTFNDCVPVEWAEENDKLIFEVPVKGQYTIFPQLGMYLRFSDGNSLIGKTNVVKTMILHHKDNTIDTSNSIELFEQYRKDNNKLFQEQKSKLLGIVDSIKPPQTRVFFKRNCPNWSTPRVYIFNKGIHLPSFCENTNPWEWNDSPYMTQDENDPDLFYFDLPIMKYPNIIFFCNIVTSDGFNFKTNDLIIPDSIQYQSEFYYWQSPIGFDGLWVDKNKETFSVYLQYTPWKDVNVKVDDNILSGEYLGIIGTGVGASYDYTKYNIPITANNITISMPNNKGGGEAEVITKNYQIYELCYNIPIAFINHWDDNGDFIDDSFIKIFDGSIDYEFLIETRYSAREQALVSDIDRTVTYGLQSQIDNLYSNDIAAIRGDISNLNDLYFNDIVAIRGDISNLYNNYNDLLNMYNELISGESTNNIEAGMTPIINIQGKDSDMDPVLLGNVQTYYCKFGKLINCIIIFNPSLNSAANSEEVKLISSVGSVLPFPLNSNFSVISPAGSSGLLLCGYKHYSNNDVCYEVRLTSQGGLVFDAPSENGYINATKRFGRITLRLPFTYYTE